MGPRWRFEPSFNLNEHSTDYLIPNVILVAVKVRKRGFPSITVREVIAAFGREQAILDFFACAPL